MTLKDRLTRPGFTISALAHAGALAVALIAFSTNEKFDEEPETIPVEVVTDNQFNQIMKGDKAAKEVHPEAQDQTQPAPSAVTPPPPPPPPVEAKQDPLPPAPPPPPTPPTPPVRPAPPPPEAVPVPTPPVRDVEAEPIPKPMPKPQVAQHAAVPKPPQVAQRAAVPKPPHDTHPTPKPKPVEKKPDELAKLLEQPPPIEPPRERPAPTPKAVVRTPPPTPAPTEEHKFDLTDITKLLMGHDTPAAKPTATSQTATRTASLGSPTARDKQMSPSFWAGLDGLLEDQYRSCWSYLGLTTGVKYIPQVRVVYAADGSLEGQPVLINPPSDPQLQSLADSAMRAVRRCNPLKIPEQYAPYYEQWKGRVLRFDPQEMAG